MDEAIVLQFALTLALLFVGEQGSAESAQPNTLTDAEQKAGWRLLFDGKTMNGWHGLGMERDVPATTWTVENGCLRCLGGYKGAVDLATNEQYENFEFAFDWRFPKTKGNSGVKYRVQEQSGKGYAFGCEYQIMNDPDGSDRHASGSLYDLFAPEGKKLVPQGEFNRSRIVVQGNRLEHWLNDVKVLEAEFESEAMKAALAKSYFKKSDWGKNPRGYLALQNHHSEVLFRNLKIRILASSRPTPKSEAKPEEKPAKKPEKKPKTQAD